MCDCELAFSQPHGLVRILPDAIDDNICQDGHDVVLGQSPPLVRNTLPSFSKMDDSP